MKSTIFSAIAIFATLAAALPTAAPAETTVGIPAPPQFQVLQVINSSAVVNINEDTPDTALGVSTIGVVSRTNNGHNSQALVKFDFPAGLGGHKCRLAFGSPSRFSGTGRIQVYTIGDANIASATFNQRPFRDQFKGSFRVTGWGEAEVVDVSGLTFDCPTQGAKAYEVVSVGDNNEVIWYAAWGGLRIDVL
ncbi:unnamed protein product [Tuber aestivum]|uniref:Ubiquitin 3 binding protein But2 C-terminal domain-containing protein n=1 Tax=Tuber aestivum TaxID=59557 RepID=A0A292PJU9_9PEZI|nr:unnamed protein product [Tuber aestivum]